MGGGPPKKECPLYLEKQKEQLLENKNNRRRTAVGVSTAKPNRSGMVSSRSSMVCTRDKVRCIHTINMNWPKHELSEYTHDVRHRVQRSTCRNLVILIIMHDYHVRTVNWGTMNTIDPSTTPSDRQ